MRTVNCLCCNKELEVDEYECVSGGGSMEIRFGYGSTLDQGPIGLYVKASSPRLDKLLACDKMKAYVCDDCFQAREAKVEGYNEPRRQPDVRVV